jgi:hypothetical protein
MPWVLPGCWMNSNLKIMNIQNPIGFGAVPIVRPFLGCVPLIVASENMMWNLPRRLGGIGFRPVGYRQSSMIKRPGRLYPASLGLCIVTPCSDARNPRASIH